MSAKELLAAKGQRRRHLDVGPLGWGQLAADLCLEGGCDCGVTASA
jgi:hypothetical protein